MKNTRLLVNQFDERIRMKQLLIAEAGLISNSNTSVPRRKQKRISEAPQRIDAKEVKHGGIKITVMKCT